MDDTLAQLRRAALIKEDAESWQRYACALEQTVGVPKVEGTGWVYVDISKIPWVDLLTNKVNKGFLLPVKARGRVDKLVAEAHSAWSRKPSDYYERGY